MSIRVVLCYALVTVLAGCSGGGESLPASSSPGTRSATGTLQLQFAQDAQAASARRPAFLSPSASSVAIAVNGGTPVVADIAAGSPACTGSGSTRTCAVTVTAPFGADTFAVTIYQGSGATGNVLGIASVVQTIGATTFGITIIVNGVVASVTLAATSKSFTAGKSSTTTISATALDAAGHTIIGTYATPLALASSDASAFALSTTSIASSGQTSILTYNGSATTGTSITATAANLLPANSTPIAITVAANNPLNIYAANLGNYSLTVTPANATGNTAATRTVVGAATGIAEPYDVAVDGLGDAYVSGLRDATVTAYAAGANGNAAPIVTIAGNNTGLNGPLGLAFDGSGDLFVANFFAQTVTVFGPSANGNTPPIRTIAGAATGIAQPYGLTLDAQGDLYLVNNKSQFGGVDSITEYAAGANGNTAPIRTIAGSSTGMSGAVFDAVDSLGNIYVTNYYANTITAYAPGASGNVAPIATIAGPSTGLSGPSGISLDAANNIYVASSNSILVFAAGSNGNVAPVRSIAGANSGLSSPVGITLAP